MSRFIKCNSVKYKTGSHKLSLYKRIIYCISELTVPRVVQCWWCHFLRFPCGPFSHKEHSRIGVTVHRSTLKHNIKSFLFVSMKHWRQLTVTNTRETIVAKWSRRQDGPPTPTPLPARSFKVVPLQPSEHWRWVRTPRPHSTTAVACTPDAGRRLPSTLGETSTGREEQLANTQVLSSFIHYNTFMCRGRDRTRERDGR